ncbi:prephenate dehydrogenase [Mobilitalea sibirica]|uniref:Prephenate dehydrogenase n=1 Tax=Mobilitalea sibirica TaxID=1462919 RepID=A0A8J7KSS8_9FIRM|nr:prephenate dehydrogenase [Mobilitalea sibirica]MBH1940611.1 prephenate dehydrogenase [Mobilitalea sibirica]
MKELKIGFIGFGLIGGSIARALKKINPDVYLYAYDYHKNKPSSDLAAALHDGNLNEITFSLDKGIPECDFIFLCAPVLANIAYVKQLKAFIKPTCILTDVGSVKGNIHTTIEEIGLEKQFIGGHPMTGSEKTGYLNSYALLLENAYYILTPTKKSPKDKVALLYHLVKKMGSIPILLEAKEHDEITAAISHVPHIIAAQLVNLIKDSDDKAEKMRALAAGGFKDITRIASSSPVMWQNICLTNATDIKRLLDRYIQSLRDASEALGHLNEDYLYQMFDQAGEYRNSIPNKSIGLMKKVFEIYLDIMDEAGAIATIATLLASNQISIKNIGIIHNREFEEGVLRIEFYDQMAEENAISLLKKYNYRVYER